MFFSFCLAEATGVVLSGVGLGNGGRTDGERERYAEVRAGKRTLYQRNEQLIHDLRFVKEGTEAPNRGRRDTWRVRNKDMQIKHKELANP